MHGCRNRSIRRAIWLGVLLAMAAPQQLRAAEAPAPSKEDVAKAKLHFQSGAVLYEAGKYEAAREAFEESYRLSQLPDLLFNLSSVARKLGRPVDAMRYLEQYLEARPSAPDRGKVEEDINALKAEVAAEQAAAEKAATEKAAAEKEAAEKAAALRLAATAEPEPSRPPPRRIPPWPALGLAGGGAAFLIIGIGVGGAALSTAGQVDGGAVFDKGLHERGQAMERAAIAFDVLGGLALAGGAAWTTVWWLKRRQKEPGVALRLVPQGAGLGLQGSF